MKLTPREVELQAMRLRGRAEKQARLERDNVEPQELEDLIADRSAPRAADAILKNYLVTPKHDTINELKQTMKRKVYVKRKKPVRPARHAKASR